MVSNYLKDKTMKWGGGESVGSCYCNQWVCEEIYTGKDSNSDVGLCSRVVCT